MESEESKVAKISIEEAAHSLLSLRDATRRFSSTALVECVADELQSALDRGDYDAHADHVRDRSISDAKLVGFVQSLADLEAIERHVSEPRPGSFAYDQAGERDTSFNEAVRALCAEVRVMRRARHVAYVGRMAAGVLIFSGAPSELALAFRRRGETVGLPCGKVDPGETPAQAAVREAFEETGFHVEIDGDITPYVGYDINDTLVWTFRAKIVGGDMHGEIREGSPYWASCQDLVDNQYGVYNARMLHHFGVTHVSKIKGESR